MIMLCSRSSLRSVGAIPQQLAHSRARTSQLRSLVKNSSLAPPKRLYSSSKPSFTYEEPKPSTPLSGPSNIQGAFLLLSGAFIGWKTRVSYVKHKYGDPSLTSVTEEEDDGYTGLDWTENAVWPALDLEIASKKLIASQKTYEFVAKAGNDVSRLDTIRFGSNAPIEDQMAHDTVDVGLGESRNLNFWGIYDGHAGWATAKVLKQSLIVWVARAIKNSKVDNDFTKAITTAFIDLDNAITTHATDALSSTSLSPAEVVSRLAPASSGSCALLGIHDPATSTLYVACIGDSRAVLGRRSQSGDNKEDEWTALPLSVDQTGFNPAEVERMAKAHPGEKSVIDPKTGRVLGIAVSRAFGDARWKWPLELIKDAKNRYWDKSPRPDYKSPPYLTAEPVVTSTTVQPGDFLILASDGLWDHISSEDAVKAVSLWVMGQRNPEAMRILTSLASIGDAAKKDEKPSVPEDWKTTEEYFTVSEGDNVASHLARQSLGGNRKELFCSVVGLKPPTSRNVRDDITIQVIFFGDVIGGK